MSGHHGAFALFMLASVASSASGSFGKALFGAGWSVGAVALLRPVVAGLVLMPVAAVALLRQRPSFRESMRATATLGIFGIAGTSFCYYHAVARMPVGTALMLLYLTPVLMLAWRSVRHRETPSAATVLGAVVSLGGLALIVTAMGVDRPDPVGVVWGLAGAVCGATYYLATGGVSTEIPVVLLSFTGQCLASLVLTVLALLGVSRVSVGATRVELAGSIVPALVPVLLIGCLSTAFVSAVTLTVIRMLGSRLSSFLALAEPIAALGLAWILLGESPRLVQYVGCALIVAGVAAIRADRGPRVRPEQGDEATDPFLPPS
jgi:drug/metabolite transporter (DMT)-like permease